MSKLTSRRNLLHLLAILSFSSFLFALVIPHFLPNIHQFYFDRGDYPLAAPIYWDNFKSLVNGNIFNPKLYGIANQHYPLPFSHLFQEVMLVPSFIFSFFYLISHDVIFSINLWFFLSFPLSFVSSYYVFRYFTKHTYSSLIGAFVYTFNPLVMGHMEGHLQFLSRFFLPPLYFFAYIYFRRPTYIKASLFGLFFLLCSLSSVYFQVFSIVTLPIFAVIFLVKNGFERNKVYFAQLFKTLFVFIPFIVVVLYFSLPYQQFSHKENIKRSIEDNIHFSGNLIDWFIPYPHTLVYRDYVKDIIHPLVRKEADNSFNYSEHVLFLNVLPTLLFLIGCKALIIRKTRQSPTEDKTLIVALLSLMLVTSILTFGPIFLGWNSASGTIKLPFYYLYKLFGFFAGIRVPTRFQFIFYIPFALLVAFGARHILINRKKSRVLLITVILFFILVVENINLRPYDETSHIITKLDRNKNSTANIVKILKGKATVHLPVYVPNYPEEVKYYTWSMLTGEKTVNGYSGYFASDWSALLFGLNNNFHDKDSINRLRSIGVDYLVIHKDIFAQDFPKLYPSMSVFLSNNDVVPYIVFQNNETVIIDLNYADDNFHICTKEDIKTDLLVPDYAVYGQKIGYQYVVVNEAECYLPSIFMDRYIPVTIVLNGTTIHSFIKLPLVIGPHETYISSGELLTQSNRLRLLSVGTYRGSVTIEKFGLLSEPFTLVVDDNISPQYINSLKPSKLAYDVDKVNFRKGTNNLYIQAEFKNTGDTIWLGRVPNYIVTKEGTGEIRLGIGYLDADKQYIKDNLLETITTCVTESNSRPDATAMYVCKYPIDPTLLTRINYLELNLFDGWIKWFDQKAITVAPGENQFSTE